MAVPDASAKDLQSLAALLADIENRLASEPDQREFIQLKELRQRCLVELALAEQSERRQKDSP
jgi:hypothetical protein